MNFHGSSHSFTFLLELCALLEAMFILLIVQLEWVQTWLAVAELQPESDISPLGLLLLLLRDLLLQECLSPNFTASFYRDASLYAVAGDPSGPWLERLWALSYIQGS